MDSVYPVAFGLLFVAAVLIAIGLFVRFRESKPEEEAHESDAPYKIDHDFNDPKPV
jgi:hypothetical protein